MQYQKGKHCVFYHRYHLVWSTKYRYQVLFGDVRLRVREIIRQVCSEHGVEIIHGVLSSDHVHMFVSVPPKLAISDLMRLMKGRSSHKVQREFPQLKKRYWGKHFWGRVTFQPPTARSPRTSYFSIWKSISKILPSPDGSGLVLISVLHHSSRIILTLMRCAGIPEQFASSERPAGSIRRRRKLGLFLIIFVAMAQIGYICDDSSSKKYPTRSGLIIALRTKSSNL